MNENYVIVIPARMDSTRLPGKPMLEIGGRPLVEWIYIRAMKTLASIVVVATDGNSELERFCRKASIRYTSTLPRHQNGTSRCLEAFDYLPAEVSDVCSKVVNWQCDVLANPEDVDKLLISHDYGIRTLVAPLGPGDMDRPDVVKAAVFNERAHWFSRASMTGALHHVGVYGFHPSVLRQVARLVPQFNSMSPLEQLEQLTWLEEGNRIHASMIDEPPLSINTLIDYKVAVRAYEEGALTL